ncbi:MAG: BspA family leucine-rich repeat surface protein [Saccharofermentanales bacterium]
MKKIEGKQIKDGTIEQRSMKVLSDSITENNSVTNKEYVLEKVNQSISGLYQACLNLNMESNNATVGELACESGVIEFPLSPVMVKLNGILMSVGPDKDFYFSPDGGTTKREGGFAEKGDKLYWNSSDYDLDDQDEIDLVYLVGYEYIEGGEGDTVELNPIYNSIVVKFNGGLSETMIVVINGTEIDVGNIGGQFVWDIDGDDEHTFTEVGESIVVEINGEEYTVWFDGFGSLIFSIRKGNFKVENNTQPFIMQVKTDNLGTTNDNQFRIPTNPSYTYDYTVEQYDDLGNVLQTLENQTGDVTLTWDVAGTYLVKIYPKADGSGFPAIYFNYDYDSDKLLDVMQWGSSKWQTMAYAFYGCSNFDSTAIDSPNLSNVTNMSGMFGYATSFNQDISGWDVGNVTNMGSMFEGATSFNQDISGWDVGNVTNMRSMFEGCTSFNQDLNSWDVSSVTDMSYMFIVCTSFNQDLSGWCVSLIPTEPAGFDNGATAWVLPRPVWGTCPGEIE